MLTVFRLRHVLSLGSGTGGALAALLFVGSGCGPQPVGVEACRAIESARCDAAASCGMAKEDVESCKLLYQDQCLHGIANAGHRPTQAETDGCVAAVKAVGACAAAGVEKMSGCDDAPLVAGAGDPEPCDIVLSRAEDLAACSFVDDADAGAGTTTTTSSSTSSSSSGAGSSSSSTGTGSSTN